MADFLTFQDLRAQFNWNAKAQRYITPAGRFVSQSALNKAMQDTVAANAKEITQLSRQVANGEIEIGEWQDRMAGAVKNLDMAMMSAGKGGIAQLTQRDYGLAGQRLRFDYDRLEQFARDIESGKIQGAAIERRAAMYISRRNATYQNTRRDAALEVFTHERRVLDPIADHCKTCVAEAGKGWQPIGTLRKISDSECLVNCLCVFAFETGNPVP